MFLKRFSGHRRAPVEEAGLDLDRRNKKLVRMPESSVCPLTPRPRETGRQQSLLQKQQAPFQISSESGCLAIGRRINAGLGVAQAGAFISRRWRSR